MSSDTEASILSNQVSENNNNVNDLVMYNSALSKLLDKHAPIRTSTVAERNTVPWMIDAILEVKRVRRQHERP